LATRGDCATFHASACSRPPPPTTNTFIGVRYSSMSERWKVLRNVASSPSASFAK